MIRFFTNDGPWRCWCWWHWGCPMWGSDRDPTFGGLSVARTPRVLPDQSQERSRANRRAPKPPAPKPTNGPPDTPHNGLRTTWERLEGRCVWGRERIRENIFSTFSQRLREELGPAAARRSRVCPSEKALTGTTIRGIVLFSERLPKSRGSYSNQIERAGKCLMN